MAVGTTRKDPNSTRKYTIRWSRWLSSQTPGETLAGSEWLVPEGLIKIQDAFDDTNTVVWLSGGTAGATYEVVNRVTTSIGQIQDATLELIMESQ